jgi:hypothetical protein
MTGMDGVKILRRGAWALLVLGLLAVALLFGDFGITWDETIQAAYGERVLDYFASGLTRDEASGLADLRFYAPLFEVLAALTYRVTGWASAEVRHFLIGVTALLALVGLVRFAGLFRTPWLPVFAGLALLTLPRFFGHAFNNSKDIPYACAFVWALWALGRMVARNSLTWRDAGWLGLTFGLCMAVRPGGMLLFGYLAAGVTLCWFGRERPEALRPGLLLARLLAVVAVAWLLMVAMWPWAHQNPLVHPVQAFFQATDFSATYPQLFEGRMVPSSKLPWHYLPKYLLLTTPPLTLLLALVGLAAGVRRQLARPRSAESRLWFLAQLWLLFPLVYVVVMRPNVYNGLRHFLFLLPALALLAGFGATVLLSMVSHASARRTVAAALAVALLLPAVSLVRLHPYQMTYFNFLAGGVGSAWERYDTDYWASSYREAALWVNEHKRPGSDGKTIVLLTANSYSRPCFAYYSDPDVEVHTIWDEGDPVPDAVDYYVAMTRLGTHETFAQIPMVHRIGRRGAVFTEIHAW